MCTLQPYGSGSTIPLLLELLELLKTGSRAEAAPPCPAPWP